MATNVQTAAATTANAAIDQVGNIDRPAARRERSHRGAVRDRAGKGRAGAGSAMATGAGAGTATDTSGK
jgi:hypothetical protein